jgi:hypothetical protein
LRRLVALVSTLALLLAGCTPSPATVEQSVGQSSSAADPATRTRQAQSVLDALTRAVTNRDQAAFTGILSGRDPLAVGPARIIFDNLTGLPLTRLSFTARPEFAGLSEDRRRALGSEAWVQQVRIIWQLSDDAGPAEHTVWLTMVPGGAGAQLAAVTDRPAAADPSPIWWSEPVVAERSSNATTLVSASLGTSGRWADAGAAAASTVAEHVQRVAPNWSGKLVVEVPGSRRLFEQVLGAKAGSYAHIAAVTSAEGPNPASAALRIVVNPAAAGRLTDLGLEVLLAHEATHVATRSVDSPAPVWAVEGFADYVAYEAYPKARKDAIAPLLADIRKRGEPTRLPSNASFRASASGLGLTYAKAWLACRYVADTHSPRELDRLYSELDRGRTLEQATQSVLIESAEEFVAGWRSYLLGLAG